MSPVQKSAVGFGKRKSVSWKENPRDCLDYSLYNHSCDKGELTDDTNGMCKERRFIQDIRYLFRVMVMFLPLPVYLAIYGHAAVLWLVQSVRMDGRLFGDFTLLPEQMGVSLDVFNHRRFCRLSTRCWSWS